MNSEKYTNEQNNNINFLNKCINEVYKGMDFLKEKGIESEFIFYKKNDPFNEFNETFHFNAINNGNLLHYNSVSLEAGDINTILDKIFRYMAANGYTGFDSELSDYEPDLRYIDDKPYKKETVIDIMASEFENIKSQIIKEIEDTNMNYNASVKHIDFSVSSTRSNKINIVIMLSNYQILRLISQNINLFDIGRFFYDENYIKQFYESNSESFIKINKKG